MKTALTTLALVFCLFANFASAQWVQQPALSGWDIEFVDVNTGWHVGDQGLVSKTTNGGGSWVTQSLGVTDLRCRGIEMINANTGYICTQSGGKVFKTTNGGANWIMSYDYGSNSLYAMEFLNSNTGIAVGSQSHMLMTTNGGTSWLQGVLSGNGDFYDVCIISGSVFYITTSDGKILKTTTGGGDFNIIHTESSDISSIMFLDEQTGFATLENGPVLKTTNAGINWTKYNTGANFASQVYFVSSHVGYICSSGSTSIRVSTNGGVSWTGQTVANFMTRMHFINPNTGWTISMTGMFKTTTGGFGIPNAPVVTAPVNNAVNIPLAAPLAWDSLVTLTSYRVQVSTDSLFGTANLDITQSNSSMTAPVGSLGENTKYFWRVCAINAAGTGPWSSPRNFTTGMLPAAATLLAPANNAMGLTVTPLLDWDSTGTSFRVQVSQDSLFIQTRLDVVLDSSSVTVPPGRLAPNTKYYWRVRASNSIGSALWSPKWNFTTSPLTGVGNTNGEIPQEFKLYNNYPNPFNPSTNIKFDISNASHVKITVYDMLGKAVATLIDKQMNAGKYEKEFTANGLTSGVYFYQIEAGDFRQVMKMVLAK